MKLFDILFFPVFGFVIFVLIMPNIDLIDVYDWLIIRFGVNYTNYAFYAYVAVLSLLMLKNNWHTFILCILVAIIAFQLGMYF